LPPHQNRRVVHLTEPTVEIHRHKLIEDRTHINRIRSRIFNEMREEDVRKLYDANPWAKRIAEQHPESGEHILALLKKGQAEAGRAHNLDMLINEAFGKIEWAYDVTRTGPRMRESRPKTAPELYKSHMKSIRLEALGLRKSLEFQARYIESLQSKGIGRLFSWFPSKRNRTRRAAIKTLRLNQIILPEFERTAETTQQRLTQVFNALEAEKTRDGFTQKDMEKYANAFAGVMSDFAQFRTLTRRALIGSYASPVKGRFELRGRTYAKRQKTSLKRIGLEPTGPFKQVMAEIDSTVRRERNAMNLVDKAMKGTGRNQAKRVATLAAARQN